MASVRICGNHRNGSTTSALIVVRLCSISIIHKKTVLPLNPSLANNSTFMVQSLDRKKVKWEKHIYDLSPVQKVGDLYFKREDYFAPLGHGNINRSKLRVCISLI